MLGGPRSRSRPGDRRSNSSDQGQGHLSDPASTRPASRHDLLRDALQRKDPPVVLALGRHDRDLRCAAGHDRVQRLAKGAVRGHVGAERSQLVASRDPLVPVERVAGRPSRAARRRRRRWSSRSRTARSPCAPRPPSRSGATTGPSSTSMSATLMRARRLRPRSAPDELAHEVVRRVAQDLLGRRELLDHPAPVQDRDAIGQLDGLVDVVGHEHDRLAQPRLDVQELVLQAGAHDRIDGGERLVHQHHGRIGGERPGDPDALPLPAATAPRGTDPAAPARGSKISASSSIRATIRASSQPTSVGHRGHVAPHGPVRHAGRSSGSRSRSPDAAAPDPVRARRCPSTWIEPAVGSISRLIIFIVVVLPHPEGPTSTTISPSRISSERSPTAEEDVPG